MQPLPEEQEGERWGDPPTQRPTVVPGLGRAPVRRETFLEETPQDWERCWRLALQRPVRIH